MAIELPRWKMVTRFSFIPEGKTLTAKKGSGKNQQHHFKVARDLGGHFMKPASICVLLALTLVVAGAQQSAPATPPSMSSSLGLHAFPAKSQTPEQQQQDETGCYNWAKQDSGFDPIAAFTAQQQAAPPQPATPAKPQTQGAGAKGAAGGAATGAVVGAIAGDAGKGAAVGAAAGAVGGRARARRAEKQAQVQTQQQQQQQAQQQTQAKAQTQQNLDSFKKGYSACMEAKGYVVK
jgi:hypothetical protein